MKSKNFPLISVVAPMYNEEKVCSEFIHRVNVMKCNQLSHYDLELIIVDDWSTDSTLKIIKNINKKMNLFLRVIRFKKNLGLESAIHAGLDASKGKYIIVMDTDLQDPPEIIPKIINMLEGNLDIVHMKRGSRIHDNYGKIMFAKIFYLLQKFVTGSSDDLANFKGLKRPIVKEILQQNDKSTLFRIKALRCALHSQILQYDRLDRFDGITKFNFIKSFKLAFHALPVSIKSIKNLLFLVFLNHCISVVIYFIIIMNEITNMSIFSLTILLLCINLILVLITYAMSKKMSNDINFAFTYSEEFLDD